MYRAATSIALAALALLPAAVAGQQGRWLTGVNGGCASGIGDNFEGPGSVTATGSIFRPVGRNVDLGVELGYHGLGTTTTRVADLYGPGSTYREDFTRSAWQATANARFRPGAVYATAAARSFHSTSSGRPVPSCILG